MNPGNKFATLDKSKGPGNVTMEGIPRGGFSDCRTDRNGKVVNYEPPKFGFNKELPKTDGGGNKSNGAFGMAHEFVKNKISGVYAF